MIFSLKSSGESFKSDEGFFKIKFIPNRTLDPDLFFAANIIQHTIYTIA
jgi:hypothetical protein